LRQLKDPSRGVLKGHRPAPFVGFGVCARASEREQEGKGKYRREQVCVCEGGGRGCRIGKGETEGDR
jgi:hypothetical protein